MNDVPLGIILKKLKIINFSPSLVSKSSRNNNKKKQWNYFGIKMFFFVLSSCNPSFNSIHITIPFILTVRFVLALLLERSFSPSHLLPLYTLLYIIVRMKSHEVMEWLKLISWQCFPQFCGYVFYMTFININTYIKLSEIIKRKSYGINGV